MNKVIPVTILTGYLGAGKTTLLNNLIEKHQDKNFAVVENEFGDISIDDKLVNRSSEGIYELSNGCVCCSLNTELGNVLNKLLVSKHDFDHVLIEATGVADPSKIASLILQDLHFQSVFRLDGVICLVDGVNFFQALEKDDVLARQVAYADVVLLNKIDASDSEELKNCEERILSTNPFTKVVKTKNAETDLPLLDIKSSGIEKSLNSVVTGSSSKKHPVKSYSFEFDKPFDPQKLQMWLSFNLQMDNRIFRAKGIIYLSETSNKLVLQSVANDYIIDKGDEWGNEKKSSKFVFIGKDLDRNIIYEGLENCLN
ncbi:CobW family GTP-binding protein [Aureibacter tunicatorum]|uniref:G3E family GTPase n=1 Tax=Aureibacter tunicatorum TaxID=866807 RepID=A0AAE3XG89_9BACT|nr:GTP-binding protein [Aureibacter tunicatorum]MDR6237036.1 G3E family GTPase [Aureibacter tunicatorum]BDD06028.1 zinc transporter [Aureibacter tunicatorum]